jgi:hypothetical protein
VRCRLTDLNRLFIVNALSEEFRHSGFLILKRSSFLCLYQLPVISERFVLGIFHNRSFAVSSRTIVILSFEVGDRSLVQCFLGLRVNLKCVGGGLNRGLIVAKFVRDQSDVLAQDHYQVTGLLRLIMLVKERHSLFP